MITAIMFSIFINFTSNKYLLVFFFFYSHGIFVIKILFTMPEQSIIISYSVITKYFYDSN